MSDADRDPTPDGGRDRATDGGTDRATDSDTGHTTDGGTDRATDGGSDRAADGGALGRVTGADTAAYTRPGLLSYNQVRLLKKAGFVGALAVTLFGILFPIFWMIHTSLRPREDIFIQAVPVIPRDISFEHYRILLFESNFPTFYLNSIMVALGVVVLTVLLSTLGGYGLARIEIPFKKSFARLVLFGYMFPAILLSIPMFIIWRQINLTNNFLGLILAETALSLPFSLWLMWQFFQTVPVSLEESARVAGATRFRAFADVAIPIAKPGMIAVALFSYAVSWNEYTIPKIMMIQTSKWPLTVGLFTFSEGHRVFWGQIMAASFLIVIPAFVFVIVLQKYLLEGFRTTGV